MIHLRDPSYVSQPSKRPQSEVFAWSVCNYSVTGGRDQQEQSGQSILRDPLRVPPVSGLNLALTMVVVVCCCLPDTAQFAESRFASQPDLSAGDRLLISRDHACCSISMPGAICSDTRL